MASTDLIDELQRLQLMIKAVRKTLRPEDTEAARLLFDITERLMLLSQVAEAATDPEDEPAPKPIDDASRP